MTFEFRWVRFPRMGFFKGSYDMTDRSKFCATCGRERKPLEMRRDVWRFEETPLVPRILDLKPWQMTNDLIVMVSIYRNGGTDEATHLCDDCLRIGLRAIKVTVDAVNSPMGSFYTCPECNGSGASSDYL